jgi:hypothetical protein
MSRRPSSRQAAALERPCPTCQAATGQPCTITRDHGGCGTRYGLPMRYAHARRLPSFSEIMAKAREELRERGVIVDASRGAPARLRRDAVKWPLVMTTSLMQIGEKMIDHRKPAKDRRTEGLSIWFTKEEREAMGAAATADGRTVSSWARQVIVRELGMTPKKGAKK